MTPDMAFQCLLVSHDPSVFCPVDRILRDFSISTSICATPSRAASLLEEGTTDLIVIDWEGPQSAELLHDMWRSRLKQKPTVVAVSQDDRGIPGVHVVVKKPVTKESVTKSVRVAYSKMLHDFRRHARYPLLVAVEAKDDADRVVPITVTNIGDGGIGLVTRSQLDVGAVLAFRLPLPGVKKDIYIQARVLWTRQYGAAGCEFLRIPPVDLQLMHDWLRAKCPVKKPRIDEGLLTRQ